MRQRRRAGAVAFALVAALPVAGTSAPAAATSPPNIVLILTDDQSMDTMAAMPYLTSQPDGHWVEFPNAFINTPLCCPSRATILSGQYSWHTGVTENAEGYAFDDTRTIATWLDGAGYRTGLVGKYLNTYPFGEEPFVPPGWDEWTSLLAHDIGYFDYTLNENGVLTEHGSSEADYVTDVLTDRAVAFLDNPSPDPFFLYFAVNAPHGPWTPAPRHATAFEDVPMPRSPNVDEEDVSDKPAWVQQLPRMTPSQELMRERNMRDEFRTVLGVDEAIATLFDNLRASGQLDNTVVVFMTDNGYSWFSHRYERKKCVYEECIRTPFLVRYPWGAAEGRTLPDLVSNVDIASTFAELAGVSPSIPQDGQSLVPLLAGTSTTWRDRVFLGLEDAYSLSGYFAVRTVDFKYVELVTGEHELYDLVVDPYELDNVAGTPAYAEVEAELADSLDGLSTIWLDLEPSIVTADGVSSSFARVRLRYANDLPRPGEQVTIISSGDVGISPVVDQGDGSYRATITASTTSGEETITATMGPIEATAVLTEAPAFAVTSVSPDARGQWAPRTDVTVTGEGFQEGATVSFGPGVKVKSSQVVDGTSIVVSVSVAKQAAVGPRIVTVTNPDSSVSSCVACFTVTPPPLVASVDPGSLSRGEIQPVTIVGDGFVPGATVKFGAGVYITEVTVTDPTTLVAAVRIGYNASPGQRKVTVGNPDGGRAVCTCFEVTVPEPP